MPGLLLWLRDKTRSSPGRCFWPCFEPLRSIFDSHYWIVNQPWMGAPDEFDFEREVLPYESRYRSGTQLWRPGSLGRWADSFSEEWINLWAVSLAEDPSRVASAYSHVNAPEDHSFIEAHAVFWLSYTDSVFWEIFARDPAVLGKVTEHLALNPMIRPYATDSRHREITASIAARDASQLD